VRAGTLKRQRTSRRSSRAGSTHSDPIRPPSPASSYGQQRSAVVAGGSFAAPEDRRRFLAGCAGIALAAIVVRALYFHQLAGTLPFSTLIVDGRAYDAWAQRIAAGDWLGSEVFYQAPLYPYALGSLYALFGRDPMLVRLLQAASSVSACLFLAWAGRRLFGSRAGLIAGWMLALYPPAFFYDGLIQKGALDLWLMCLLLVVVVEAHRRRSWHWLLAAGAVLGALTLNRENARLLWPVLAIWIWLDFRQLSPARRAVWIAAFAVGTAFFLLPVGLRNYHVGGELVLSTSQLGSNFYIGNRAGASGRYEPLVPRRGDPRFERADATRLAEEAVGRTLSPGEVSRYWLRRAFDDIRSQPGKWLELMGWKSLLVVHRAELADAEDIEVYAHESWILRRLLPFYHFGIVMPLAVLGVWLTRARWRELWIHYAMFAALAASTAIFYVFGRYRFLLLPIALLFASAALSRLPGLVATVRTRVGWREWLPGLLVASITAVVCNFPLPDVRNDALTYWNLGSGLLLDGRPADAIAPLERALAIRPDLAGAHHSLALAYLALGDRDSAVKATERALEYAPDYGDAHALLGQYFHDEGVPDKAIEHLSRAASLVSDPALLYVELAQVRLQQGDERGAVADLRAALRADPASPVALNKLTWLLATDPDPQRRDGAEAVRLARQLQEICKRLKPLERAALFDTVAAAYAEAGRFDDARQVVAEALAIAQAENHPRLAGILESRQKLYEARQPYRESREASRP
jgi:tetratricopeptide (TPR) repeat protein